MQVAVDATPLLGARSGVGRYLDGLLRGLADLPGAPEPILTLFSIRGSVPEPRPPRTQLAPRRAPARLLNRMWERFPFPPVELLTGPVDVFHAGNFVLPPLHRAAGVVTVHDLAFLRYPATVDAQVQAYRHLVPSAIRRAGRVVTVSSAMREEIVAEFRVDPARVVVAPNGVDGSWASARAADAGTRCRLGLPERYLLFVGNVEPRKGLGTLVRAHGAAQRASSAVPPLVMVGPPGWGDAWDGATPDPRDVVRLGYLDEQDLRTVVASATALCMPSRYEGFGLPILEAMACGTPVVASNIAAHREVAGGLATLVAVADDEAWAEALIGVAEAAVDQAAAQERRAWASRFTWARSAGVHLDTWMQADAERARGPRRQPLRWRA